MSLFSSVEKLKAISDFMVAIFQRNSTFIQRTGAKVSTTSLSLRAYLFTFTMCTGKKIAYFAISLRVI